MLMAVGGQNAGNGEIQRLRLADLSDLIERAEYERWTALVIVPSRFATDSYFHSAAQCGVPRQQIARIDRPIDVASAEALSRLTNLSSLDLMASRIGDTGAEALSRMTNLNSLRLWRGRIGDKGAASLSRLTNLTSLDLGSNKIGDKGAASLSRLTNLKSLDLGSNKIGDEGAASLSWLTKLGSLDLGGNRVGSAGAEALRRLVNLKVLALGSHPIGDAGAEALSRLPNLTSLRLWRSRIGDEGAEALSRLMNLTSLDLGSNRIGNPGAEALSRLTNLKSLDLGSNQIGNPGAESLSRLTNLTTLDLKYNQIGDPGVEALSRLANLTSLDLGGNQIGAAGADALTRLTDIKSLDLGSNQIGNPGAEALSRLTNLTSLDLKHNQIGDSGAQALSRLANLTSLDLGGNQIGDSGAQALSRLVNLSSLDFRDNLIGAAGAEALSRLTKLRSLDLAGNRIGAVGSDALSVLTNLTSLDITANRIGAAGARTLLDAWADPATSERRKYLALAHNEDDLLPAEVLAQTDAQVIIAAWRSLRAAEVAKEPLPEPEAAGSQSRQGMRVRTTPDGRLTVVDPEAGSGARTDTLSLDLHAETVRALDALIAASARSNALAHWRLAAEEAKGRLGASPEQVLVSAILRIERLRALREADERRRSEPDPLLEPAEPGAAAVLREAVAAANLYIATDPYLDEQQRRLADPGTQPLLTLDEATTAEADLDAADVAEEVVLDELRNARETAGVGGEAGHRAQVWLSESWRNIVIEATRQTLAWLRDAALQARIGNAITVDDAARIIDETGVAARLVAMRAAKAGGDSAARIWRHAEPEFGKRLPRVVEYSAYALLIGYNLSLVSRLTANAELVAVLKSLFSS